MTQHQGKGALSKKEKSLLKQFGAKVKEVREKKKLSVYDVTGEDLPIKSRQHWQRIENGQKNINFTTIFKVARLLGVGPDDLLKDMR